jgi:hypothetical protein
MNIMGSDYAFVYAVSANFTTIIALLTDHSHAMYRHLIYTIPFGLCLTVVYRPLSTALDWYKICCLVIVRTLSSSMYLRASS